MADVMTLSVINEKFEAEWVPLNVGEAAAVPRRPVLGGTARDLCWVDPMPLEQCQ